MMLSNDFFITEAEQNFIVIPIEKNISLLVKKVFLFHSNVNHTLLHIS